VVRQVPVEKVVTVEKFIEVRFNACVIVCGCMIDIAMLVFNLYTLET